MKSRLLLITAFALILGTLSGLLETFATEEFRFPSSLAKAAVTPTPEATSNLERKPALPLTTIGSSEDDPKGSMIREPRSEAKVYGSEGIHVPTNLEGLLTPQMLQDLENRFHPGTDRLNSSVSTNGENYWQGGFDGLTGVTITALAVDSLGRLYVGGVGYLSVWNGTSWSSIGGTFDGLIYAIAIADNGDIYVGGTFTRVGSTNARRLAKWNGSSWSEVGNGADLGAVWSLLFDPANGDLFVGGSFTYVGEQFSPGLARWTASGWSAIPTFSGSLGGSVFALARDSAGNVYAGGAFSSVNSVQASNIARWNGVSWSPLSSGTGSSVFSIVTSGSNVFVGGFFTTAGGLSVNRVARWNGSSWFSLGTGANDPVEVLMLDSTGALIAGGNFTSIGGVSVNRIARWNGSSWSAISDGFSGSVIQLGLTPNGDIVAAGFFRTSGTRIVNQIARLSGGTWTNPYIGREDQVSSLLSLEDGGLVVAGEFVTVRGRSANRIATWSEDGWYELGDGINGAVHALAEDRQGRIYAAGQFSRAGTRIANNIARWTGTNWEPVGGGFNGPVYALASDNDGNIYATGAFTVAGVSNANRIAKWDGTAWQPLSSGLLDTGRSLAIDNSGALYVGGDFTAVGGVLANRIAKWNGSSWTALGDGMDASVTAITVSGNGEVFASGPFTVAGEVNANRIARWNGTEWRALGTGVNGTVRSLATDGSGRLLVGGEFTSAGGLTYQNFAVWHDSAWIQTPVISPTSVNDVVFKDSRTYLGINFTGPNGELTGGVIAWSGDQLRPLGRGLNGTVVTSAVDNQGRLYIGGSFTGQIARWDGTQWSREWPGFNGTVNSIAFDSQDNMFVIGSFTQINGVTMNRVARWNGTTWSSLGSGLNGTGTRLVFLGSNLFVGGDFSTAGGVSTGSVARWNGSQWSSIGGPSGFISDMEVSPTGDKLVVGGSFAEFGGGNIAVWSGTSWSAFTSGVSGFVRTLAFDKAGSLLVGFFGTTRDNSAISSLARWDGSAWRAVGPTIGGYPNTYPILDIHVDPDNENIYLTGFFRSIGAEGFSNIARWNGIKWSTLGGGINNSGWMLRKTADGLWVGGNFSGAGDKLSSRIGLFQDPFDYCNYSLSPMGTQSVEASATTLSITMSAPKGCDWTVTSETSWLEISGGQENREGSDVVQVNVQANIGPARAGRLKIGDLEYEIVQASGCSVSPSVSSLSVPYSRGETLVPFTVGDGCAWNISTDATWFSITSQTSGSGDGILGLSFEVNRGDARSAIVTIGTSSITITQEGFSCPTVLMGSVNVEPGALIEVPVGITNMTGLDVISWDFSIDFDPSVVVISEQAGFDLSGGIAQSFAFALNTSMPGRVSVSAYGSVPLSGAGNLFTLRFRVVGGRGSFSDLVFSRFQLNEGDPCTTLSGGTVSVSRGTVSGSVRYYVGQNQAVVPGVTLNALGSQNLSDITSSNGTFTLSGFGPGEYRLTPSRLEGGRNSAISALDASVAAQYAVGLIQLSPNQVLAADVTGDREVTALDASRIAQYAVGLAVPSSDQTGKWRFVPGSITYDSITDDVTAQDFLAILIGDVTGDWTAGQSLESLESKNSSHSSVISGQSELVKAIGFGLYAEEVRIPGIRSLWTDFAGRKSLGAEVLEIPISIGDALDILAYDAVITYDSDVLEPVIDRPIESNGTLSANFNIVAKRSEPGKIRLAAYGIAPVTGNGDLLVLRFRVKKPGARIEDANLRFESLMINEKSVIAPMLNRK
jgi:hypothetical protein